jgi:hypothetical protein
VKLGELGDVEHTQRLEDRADAFSAGEHRTGIAARSRAVPERSRERALTARAGSAGKRAGVAATPVVANGEGSQQGDCQGCQQQEGTAPRHGWIGYIKSDSKRRPNGPAESFSQSSGTSKVLKRPLPLSGERLFHQEVEPACIRVFLDLSVPLLPVGFQEPPTKLTVLFFW